MVNIRFRKSQSNSHNGNNIEPGSQQFLKDLKEESPEKKSRFKVGPTSVPSDVDSGDKELDSAEVNKTRFKVKPTEKEDLIVNVTATEEKVDEVSSSIKHSVEENKGGEPVVEKQDMEKLEKEEEKVELREKRGRFAVKTDQSQEVTEVPPVNNNDDSKKNEEKTEDKKEIVEETKEASAEDKKESEDDKKDLDDDKDDEITQSEEEEPKKAVEASPEGGRYLKFDEEIGRGSFKTVYKGSQELNIL